jgi:alkylation response protein AidB-like acyl-CoA dehydrogenase
MNFDLTEDQKMLAETASAFVKKESPVRRFRTLREDPLGYELAMWRRMGQMGWLGLPFDESVGGMGQSFVDVALLLEQLGTRLVPEPYLASVVLAGSALQRGGTAHQKQRLLAPMIAGESTLALAYAERQARYDVADVSTTAERGKDGFTLSGEKVFVLNGHGADVLLVSARSEGAVALFAARSAPGLTVRPIKTVDGGRAAMLRLERVAVAADARLDGGAQLLEDVVDLGAAAACAEGVGLLRTVLELTREHLCTREQFGAKLGSFQALQHRAAEMYVELELVKSASILASVGVAAKDAVERRQSVSAAKAQLSMSGRFITQAAVQLHGGIGLTDEHDVGLYFKRMLALNALFGDEEHHVSRWASR